MGLFKKSQKIEDAKEVLRVIKSPAFEKWSSIAAGVLPSLSSLTEQAENEVGAKLKEANQEFAKGLKGQGFDKQAVKWALTQVAKTTAPTSFFQKKNNFKNFQDQIKSIKKVAKLEQVKKRKDEIKTAMEKVGTLERELKETKEKAKWDNIIASAEQSVAEEESEKLRQGLEKFTEWGEYIADFLRKAETKAETRRWRDKVENQITALQTMRGTAALAGDRAQLQMIDEKISEGKEILGQIPDYEKEEEENEIQNLPSEN